MPTDFNFTCASAWNHTCMYTHCWHIHACTHAWTHRYMYTCTHAHMKRTQLHIFIQFFSLWVNKCSLFLMWGTKLINITTYFLKKSQQTKQKTSKQITTEAHWYTNKQLPFCKRLKPNLLGFQSVQFVLDCAHLTEQLFVLTLQFFIPLLVVPQLRHLILFNIHVPSSVIQMSVLSKRADGHFQTQL